MLLKPLRRQPENDVFQGILATGLPEDSPPEPKSPSRGLDIAALLNGAREGDAASIGQLLQQYRNYLMLLATTQIERRLQPRVSPSDIVQEAMLRAHRHFAQFRGHNEKELLAWLRQILITNLARFVERHVHAAKRDIRREVSLDRAGRAIDRSTSQFHHFLSGGGQTPSAILQEREEAVMLADRLAQLPPHYRDVLILRNIRGLSFDELAAEIQRAPGAARALWLRAIKRLRSIYRKEKSQDA
jgi:RNA polymerase sigma-70 factor (ECF subfamily)